MALWLWSSDVDFPFTSDLVWTQSITTPCDCPLVWSPPRNQSRHCQQHELLGLRGDQHSLLGSSLAGFFPCRMHASSPHCHHATVCHSSPAYRLQSLSRMKLLSSSFRAVFQNVPKACWRILLCCAIVATDQPSLNLWQLPPHLQFRTKFATTSKLIPLSNLLLLQAQSCDDEFLVSKAKNRNLNASGSRGRSSRVENPKPKS
jgi:hypothetical protein